MSQLAAELRASPGALTALVVRLVKASWIERVSDPDDRRSIRLQLSPDSRAKLKKTMDAKMAKMHELFDRLEPTDLAELHRILTLLDNTSTP